MNRKQSGVVSVVILVIATILIGGGVIGDHYYNEKTIEKAKIQKIIDDRKRIAELVVKNYE